MAFQVIMPQLGLTMEEGTVSKWLVHEGDTVHKGQTLLEVTTDKLTNEVMSETDGVVLKIVAGEGDDVPVKGVLAYIGSNAEEITNSEVSKPAAETNEHGRVYSSPLARRTAKERGVDYTKLAGSGPRGRIIQSDVIKFAEAAPRISDKESSDVKISASPLAKKIAADIDVDLANVESKGRVLAEDILTYLQSTRENAETAPAREEAVPMSGMRKAIAKNMLNSHMTSPTVSFNLSVDMTEVKRYREQLKTQDIKVSYTDILVKFIAKALIEFPDLNCSVESGQIKYKHYVNMGVAVALEKGLLVPNIVDADKKSLTEISKEVKELAAQAREGRLPMEKLRGGTFTITNLGMYGIESFTPIINQPEVAILGVTTMEDKAVVRNGEIVIRPMMTLSLSADHRVVDGSVAAQFLQRVKGLLENPALMLA